MINVFNTPQQLHEKIKKLETIHEVYQKLSLL